MKKKLWLWILLALLAVVIVVLAVNYRAIYAVLCNWTAGSIPLDTSNEWDGGESYLNVRYAQVSEAQYLDLYVPDTAEPAPLYVVIHGGGFIAGDAQTRQAQFMYRYFRDQGYAVATIHYRLAQEEPFPGGLEDCKTAIRYLRAHARQYGYNADKIAVFGESAGGYLATMCAVTGEDEFNSQPFTGQDTLGDVSSKVDVLINYYGAMDLSNMTDDFNTLGIPQIVCDIGNYWISDDVLQGFESLESLWRRKNLSEMTPQELAYSDPYTYINKNINKNTDLAVWIIHGDCDITVPYLQSQRLYNKLTELMGTDRVVFQLMPGMGHASDPLYADDVLAQIKTFMDTNMLP